jgi:hypothetical protein
MNQFVEKQISHLFEECGYCELSYFKPIESHRLECLHGPVKCLVCSASVSTMDLHQHIIEDCTELNWMENNSNNTSGSLEKLLK